MYTYIYIYIYTKRLVAERLPRARRHHGQDVAAREQGVDHRELEAAEVPMAPVLLEESAEVRDLFLSIFVYLCLFLF